MSRTYADEANYAAQAATYDRTRAASPTVARLLLKHLGDPAGRTVLDVAGGTGNYARLLRDEGFGPFIVDREAAMLTRSIEKIGPGRQIIGDAAALPVADGATDAAICVSALHQFPDQRSALAEARRVIRGGPFVLQAFTAESLIPSFVAEYFPGSDLSPDAHLAAEEIASILREVGFARVRRERFVYADTVDGTLYAMHTDPGMLSDPAFLRNTSFFQRLSEEARRAGLAALGRDLRDGRLAERVREGLRLAARHGHGSVFAAWP